MIGYGTPGIININKKENYVKYLYDNIQGKECIAIKETTGSIGEYKMLVKLKDPVKSWDYGTPSKYWHIHRSDFREDKNKKQLELTF